MKKIKHIFAPIKEGRIRIIISTYEDRWCNRKSKVYGFEGVLDFEKNPKQLEKIFFTLKTA